jgi:tetratricopeptide (TPR) repeat protein
MPLALVAGMHCRACQRDVPDGAAACPRCGRDPRATPPTPAPGPATPEPAAPATSDEARGLVGLVAVCLAAALLAALLFVHQGMHRAPPDGAGAPPRPAAVRLDAPRPDAAAPDSEPSDDALPAPSDPARLGPAAALYATARDAHRRGEFTQAAASLRVALTLEPAQPDLVAALATTLEAEADRRIEASDYAGAVAPLREAVGRDPGRGRAWKSLGYAQLRLGDAAAARGSLETAARLLPGDARTRLLLGVALYQSGDTAAAAAALREGRAAQAEPEFAALLEKVEREARTEAGYGKAESRHFTVRFEGGGTSEQAGYLVSLLLEDAYHRVGAALDYHPAEPIHAVLYSAEQFRDVTRSPGWAGALYDGKIRLPVGGLTEKTDLLARTIAHEYTHAVVHRLARGKAPVWLNEGLAVLSEGEGGGDLARQFRAYVKQGGRVESLRALEGSFGALNEAQARTAYAHSLAATDYLVQTYGQVAARRVLERLGEGRPIDEAVREVLYVSYDQLDRAWAESLR